MNSSLNMMKLLDLVKVDKISFFHLSKRFFFWIETEGKKGRVIFKNRPEIREVDPKSKQRRFSLKETATTLRGTKDSLTATICIVMMVKVTKKKILLLKNF